METKRGFRGQKIIRDFLGVRRLRDAEPRHRRNLHAQATKP